jgi:predicted transcriptional regulator
MSKIPMNFRLEDELIEQLKKIADHENRSLTNLIETELKKFAKNHLIIIALERGQK